MDPGETPTLLRAHFDAGATVESGDVLVAVASAVLGIATSALVAYYFWRRGSRGPALRYAISSVPLVQGTGDLEIRYRGEVVTAVTTTYVAVWNAGPESIRGADVVEPVVVSVEADRVLDAALVATTRLDIRAAVRQDQGATATLTFSHLDTSDGLTVRLLHTGSPKAKSHVGAVIVGMPSGPVELKSELHKNVGSRMISTINMIVVLAGLVAVTVTADSVADRLVAGLLLGALAVLLLHVTRSDLRNDVRQLPEGLRDVNYRKASYGPPRDG